jgi:hypothetical protein
MGVAGLMPEHSLPRVESSLQLLDRVRRRAGEGVDGGEAGRALLGGVLSGEHLHSWRGQGGEGGRVE